MSVYQILKLIVNSIIFLIEPSTTKKILKQILVFSFEPLFFNLLGIKLNNKIYQATQLKKNYSLNYKNNKLLIFQFKLINLKKIENNFI